MRRLAAVAGLAIAVAVVATAIAAPLTGNVAVNQNTFFRQEAPRVALQLGGGFLVAWEERDVGNGEVNVRRFGADGAALTDAAPVAAATLRQEAPDIDTAPDGLAVVTWTAGGTCDRDVLARRLTAAGAPTGAVIHVDDEAGTQELWRVAVSPDGTFTIVWADPEAAAGGEDDIYMSRYEADGDLIDDFAVVARPDYQLDPDVAALPDGTLVVAFWDRALGQVGAPASRPDGDMVGSEISVGAERSASSARAGPAWTPTPAASPWPWSRTTRPTCGASASGGAPAAGPVTVERVPLDEPFRRHRPGRPLRRRLDPAVGDEAKAAGVLRRARPPPAAHRMVSAAGNAGQPHSRGVAADDAGFVVAWEADDADDTGVYARRFSWGGGAAATPTPSATASPTATASPVATQDPTPAPVATIKPTPPKAAKPHARRHRPRAPVDAQVRQPPQLPDPPARAQGHEDPPRDGQGQRQARRDPQGQARHGTCRPAGPAEGALQGGDPRHHDDRTDHQGHPQIPHVRGAQEEQQVAPHKP